jgi:hypothetical protein
MADGPYRATVKENGKDSDVLEKTSGLHVLSKDFKGSRHQEEGISRQRCTPAAELVDGVFKVLNFP